MQELFLTSEMLGICTKKSHGHLNGYHSHALQVIQSIEKHTAAGAVKIYGLGSSTVMGSVTIVLDNKNK